MRRSTDTAVEWLAIGLLVGAGVAVALLGLGALALLLWLLDHGLRAIGR